MESLLSAPDAGAENFTKPFKRKKCKYECKCERFKVSTSNYSMQYCHVYFSRLTYMRKRVVKEAERKWGEFYTSAMKSIGCLEGG